MGSPKQPKQPLVLVVDDEALLRWFTRDLLEDAGFAVVEAEDAEVALKVLEHQPDIRLLMTDINMPGSLDGLDLARIVHERWPGIELVVTSGRERLRDEDIPDDGHFVAKPFPAHQLLDLVSSVTGHGARDDGRGPPDGSIHR